MRLLVQHCLSKGKTNYYEAWSALSNVIDEVRGVFRNVGETDRQVGQRPFEPLMDMLGQCDGPGNLMISIGLRSTSLILGRLSRTPFSKNSTVPHRATLYMVNLTCIDPTRRLRLPSKICEVRSLRLRKSPPPFWRRAPPF